MANHKWLSRRNLHILHLFRSFICLFRIYTGWNLGWNIIWELFSLNKFHNISISLFHDLLVTFQMHDNSARSSSKRCWHSSIWSSPSRSLEKNLINRIEIPKIGNGIWRWIIHSWRSFSQTGSASTTRR